jgi:hypothetical protein
MEDVEKKAPEQRNCPVIDVSTTGPDGYQAFCIRAEVVPGTWGNGCCAVGPVHPDNPTGLAAAQNDCTSHISRWHAYPIPLQHEGVILHFT